MVERSTKSAQQEGSIANADGAGAPRSYRRPLAVAADSPLGLGLILFWGLAGPAILFFLAVRMLREGAEVLSLSSLAYFGVALLSVALRFVDIKFFAGCTLAGRRATHGDWLAYCVVLGVSALLLWSMVQVLNAAIALDAAPRVTPFVTLAQKGAAGPTPRLDVRRLPVTNGGAPAGHAAC